VCNICAFVTYLAQFCNLTHLLLNFTIKYTPTTILQFRCQQHTTYFRNCSLIIFEVTNFLPLGGSEKKVDESRITLNNLCCIADNRNRTRKVSAEKSADLPRIQLHTVQEGIEHISVLSDDMCQFCGEFCTKVHNDSTRLKIVSRGAIIYYSTIFE
jgi:hypothetical protein